MKVHENRSDQMRPAPEHLLQHEFSVIVFLDYLCERPFDLVHQEKTIQQYQSNILGELVSVRNEIRDSWVDNRIDDGIAQIISTAQQVASEGGFGQSLRKQSMKYTLPLLIGVFIVSFAIIFFMGDLFPPDLYWLTYVIYIIPLLVICFVPRIINQRIMNRWLLLAQEQAPLVKKAATGTIERIQKFIQYLIDDVRGILAESKADMANYRLMLFNPSYQNVKVLSEEMRRGVKFYIMELLPFETPPAYEKDDSVPEYSEFGDSDL